MMMLLLPPHVVVYLFFFCEKEISVLVPGIAGILQGEEYDLGLLSKLQSSKPITIFQRCMFFFPRAVHMNLCIFMVLNEQPI